MPKEAAVRIRRATGDDSTQIVGIQQKIAAERVHSAIDVPWTVREERRYIESKMLERARSRLLASGVDAIMAIADTCSLRFCDCEMDLVMAALVLEHTLAPLDALHEMARVARPKATLLFVTTRSHAPDILFRLKFRYQPLEKSRLLGWMAGAGIRSIWSGPLSGLARPFARGYVGTKLE